MQLRVNEGETVLSDEKISTCNRILRVIGCSEYVLLQNVDIDFLLEKIGTFKMLHAFINEVYVHVRVVLTRVDLYNFHVRRRFFFFLCLHFGKRTSPQCFFFFFVNFSFFFFFRFIFPACSCLVKLRKETWSVS